MSRWVIAVLLAALSSNAATDDDADRKDAEVAPQVLAPGYAALSFEPPAAGSYALPALSAAVDGDVLTSDGARARLHDLFANRIVLFSLIYTSCNDVNGCPLATAVLHKVKRRLDAEPGLHASTRLVSLSFDPARDTPEAMRRYGAGFGVGGVEWRFATTAANDQLLPILRGYGQSIVEEKDESGAHLGTFAHILRVYLIDRDKRVRNIYSVSFLHADVLINDIKTLLMEDTVRRPVGAPVAEGAGDVRGGYESADFQTRSRSLRRRVGESIDLLAVARRQTLGLPPVPEPEGNPLTADKIALGRKLFYDRRLSFNDTFSCAMCHIPEQGFTSSELATVVGIEGRSGRRNAPTLYNVGYLSALFHDGREHTLEQQVWSPLLARNEMGNPSVGHVIEKLRRLADYDGWFERAFAGRPPSMAAIGAALASYQRTLVSGDAPFDRWFYGGEANALSEDARRGFELFSGKAGCSACHVIGKEYALFTDQQMHNTGIGYQATMRRPPPKRQVQLAPGVFVEVDGDAVAAAAERPPGDLGRYEITQRPVDRWNYRTPGLRNVALTAPYMHDGSIATLESVVRFYDRGGIPNPGLDPRIRPLGLNEQQLQDLVSFLHTLTGNNVDVLVSDAFAAPVGDAR